MCRLFGFAARRPASPVFAFFSGENNLFELSRRHSDGWGVAWVSNAGWELYKEAGPLYNSENARKVVYGIRSLLVIAHVRKASPEYGALSYWNTHPFVSGEWAFAHNGTIRGYEKLVELLGERRRLLRGTTDSEALFHLILKHIDEEGDPVSGIAAAVSQLESFEYTSLNSLLSDGLRLYALNLFRDPREDYYTMYMGRFMLEGVELVAVASEPLGGLEGWVEIGNGKLVAVDRSLSVTVHSVGRA